jgi:hypothetical protein
MIMTRMTDSRVHELCIGMRRVVRVPMAVEAVVTATNAQKIEEERYRRRLSRQPRGGYAKARAHPWSPPEPDPRMVALGRRCLPSEHDRD